MRDAVAWSYDLLTPAEQTLFRRLAIFAGGFTLGSAEHVMGTGEWGANAAGAPADPSPVSHHPPPATDSPFPIPRSPFPDLLDLSGSLVDKSLVQQHDSAAEPRFGMLETVREFGLQLLEESDERDAVAHAHADWCLRLVEEAVPGLVGPEQATWYDRLKVEDPNLRAALTWLVDKGEAAAATRFVGALWQHWIIDGRFREGAVWFDRILTMPADQADAGRGTALLGAGIMACARGDLDGAQRWLEAALAHAVARHDPVGQGRARVGLADVLRFRGNDAASIGMYEEALRSLRPVDDRPWTIVGLVGPPANG
jgi:non-specific serine/threonine protein kinase